jgi:hypothetical protein
LEDSSEETGYLIGARIADMSDQDRASYDSYVSKMLKQAPAD